MFYFDPMAYKNLSNVYNLSDSNAMPYYIIILCIWINTIYQGDATIFFILVWWWQK